MKTKNKNRTIIVALSVLAAAVAFFFIVRRKRKSTKGIVKRLGLSPELTAALNTEVAMIEKYAVEHPSGIENWSMRNLRDDAAALGIGVAQMVVIHAAYQLIAQGLINQEKYAEIKSNIITM